MTDSPGYGWKAIVESMERGTETRFSVSWFRAHPITRNLLQADIRWGHTLDLACGLGIRTALLNKEKKCPIVGLDNDDYAVEYAKRLAVSSVGNVSNAVRFVTGSFYCIPFHDDFFDNAVFIAGIEHAQYPVQCMDEIERVVRPNGRLFLSVTECNFHADPQHLSSWNENAVVRLLSCYGDVETWVDESIIYAVLTFRRRETPVRPKLVLCDLNTPDTYTPQWVQAFERLADLEVIGLEQSGMRATSDLTDAIVSKCESAEVLHLGTGANFENITDVLRRVRENAHLIISKWYGDPSEPRYHREVCAPSEYMDQVFQATLSDTKAISRNCAQFFLNGTFDPTRLRKWIPWRERPVDILVVANAYSPERLAQIRSYLPDEFNWLWVGDGSPNGRLARQATLDLFGYARTVVNAVIPEHRQLSRHITTGCYVALASGALVFSNEIPGLDDLFQGGVVQLNDDTLRWHSAYYKWLVDTDDNVIADLLARNLMQVYRYHTYDYKTYCILRHAGFSVPRHAEVRPPVDSDELISASETSLGTNNGFWDDLDRRGLKYHLADRPFFFGRGRLVERPVWLDLGCGAAKSPGFIGLDRFALPLVDVITDLNKALPFATDSVDLVFASHSLEHVDDLAFTMQEIYRVCKHGAQVCIVAPYSHQGLNLANPYHKQAFNEHTPRFWTNSPLTTISPAEYDHPTSPTWGLSESDHSTPGLDLRCLKMEFFYFSAYRSLSSNEQRAARKMYLDVCDLIMYNLVVVKQGLSEAEMQDLDNKTEYYEPSYVTLRRLNERADLLESQLSQTRSLFHVQEAELQEARIALQTREAELSEMRAAFESQDAQYRQQLEAARNLESRVGMLTEELQRREISLTTVLQQRETELVHLQQANGRLNDLLNRRAVRWLRSARQRFRRYDARDQIAPPFQQLKDDSLLFCSSLAGFKLRPGPDLQRTQFVTYPIEPRRAGLCALLLAPVLDSSIIDGRLGIELVSSDGKQILAQVAVPVSQLTEAAPVRFEFAPIAGTDRGRFWLRVFARDVTGSLRVFEWCSYSPLGFGPRRARAFCGLIFAADQKLGS